MANEILKNKLTASTGQPIGNTLKNLIEAPATKKKFEELLKGRTSQFLTSVLSLYNNEKTLQKCTPMSVLQSAVVAAALDLPVDKNLGYAWIVPYGNTAQFQLGYKGYVQLALRSGQYKFINVTSLKEGQLVSWNPLTEKIEIDFETRLSNATIGYAAYFELLNGFRKTVYWTKEEVEEHRKKFSKSDFGWQNDWNAMACKTVLKSLLSKWGILSIDMQKAVKIDEMQLREVDNVKDISTDEFNVIEYDTDNNVDMA